MNFIIEIIFLEFFTTLPLVLFFIFYKKIKAGYALKKIILYTLISLNIIGITSIIYFNLNIFGIETIKLGNKESLFFLIPIIVLIGLFFSIIKYIYFYSMGKINIQFENIKYKENNKLNLDLSVQINKNLGEKELIVFLRGYRVPHTRAKKKSITKIFENIIMEKTEIFYKGYKGNFFITKNIGEITKNNKLYNTEEEKNIKKIFMLNSFGKNMIYMFENVDLWKIEVEIGKIHEEKTIEIKK